MPSIFWPASVCFSSPNRKPNSGPKTAAMRACRPRRTRVLAQKHGAGHAGNRRARAERIPARPSCRTRASGTSRILRDARRICDREVGIAAELPVTLVDLPDRLDVEHAGHERRAARILDRERRIARRLRPAATAPSGGKLPSCGAGRPSSSTSRGQTADGVGIGVQGVGQPRDRVRARPRVSACRNRTYSASAARQPRFQALVRPKFLGSRIHCALGKSEVELRRAVAATRCRRR